MNIYIYVWVPTTQPARRWNCTKRQKTYQKWSLCQIVSTRCLQLEYKFRSSLNDRVRTATHLQIPPSSPSHPIIGDLQRLRIVPAKPLRIDVVSLWSYLIPLSGSLLGHHFRPLRCWGAD